VKRLSLGLCLIALSSSVLLISDWNQRKTPDLIVGRKWKIQLVEFNNVLDVEESEEGILAGLRSSSKVVISKSKSEMRKEIWRRLRAWSIPPSQTEPTC